MSISSYASSTSSEATNPEGLFDEDRKTAALKTGIPLDFIIDSVDKKLRSKKLFCDFCIYIPFLVMFLLFFVFGEGSGYWQATSLRLQLIENEFPNTPPNGTFGEGPFYKKTFLDIVIPADWYQWMYGVVIPQLWTGFTPSPEAAQQGVRYATGQNQLLGAMRIRTLRMGNTSCEANEHLYPSTDGQPVPCYGDFSSRDMEEGPYGRIVPPATTSPTGRLWRFQECHDAGSWIQGRVTRYPCAGYLLDIPFNNTFEEALLTFASIQAANFIDSLTTRFVSTDYYVYSASSNMFTQCNFYVEATSSGAWLPTARCLNFSIWSTTDLVRTILEVLFFAYVIYYWVQLFKDWKTSHRVIGTVKWLLSVWNILEIINLTFFLCSFVLSTVWIFQSITIEYTLPMQIYPQDIDQIVSLYWLAKYFNAVNTVITTIKLLKFLRLNDKFNILTRTLETAARNIIGILLIFLLVVFAYALTGNLLFGNGLEQFKDFTTAFSTLLRMLIGDFDYEAMRNENREIAPIYFWSFIILGLFLLLNFIIAVLAEAFSQESAKSNTQGLLHSIGQSLKRGRRLIQSLGWKKVKAMFKKLPEDTTLQYLLEYKFRKMKEQQGDDIWEGGDEFKEPTVTIRGDDQPPDPELDLSSDTDFTFSEAGENETNPTLYRWSVTRFMPPEKVEQIGRAWFDNLWEYMVNDYESHWDQSTKTRESMAQNIKNATLQVVMDLMTASGIIDGSEGNTNLKSQNVRQRFLAIAKSGKFCTNTVQQLQSSVTNVESQIGILARLLSVIDSRSSQLAALKDRLVAKHGTANGSSDDSSLRSSAIYDDERDFWEEGDTDTGTAELGRRHRGNHFFDELEDKLAPPLLPNNVPLPFIGDKELKLQTNLNRTQTWLSSQQPVQDKKNDQPKEFVGGNGWNLESFTFGAPAGRHLSLDESEVERRTSASSQPRIDRVGGRPDEIQMFKVRRKSSVFSPDSIPHLDKVRRKSSAFPPDSIPSLASPGPSNKANGFSNSEEAEQEAKGPSDSEDDFVPQDWAK